MPERREQFKIFCLALLCGLRKREIDTLLWRSVDFDKAVIRYRANRVFPAQERGERRGGGYGAGTRRNLRGYHSKAKGEFVIESPNPPRYNTSRTNYRAEADFEALYTWLAKKGVSAQKKLHELRKECGAVIANSMGIFAASRALRHSDIRITFPVLCGQKSQDHHWA